MHEPRAVHASPRFQKPFHKLGQQGALQRITERDVDVLFRNMMQSGHEQRVVGNDHGAAFFGVRMLQKLLSEFQKLGVEIISGVKAYVRAAVFSFSQKFAFCLPAAEPFLVLAAAPVACAGENVRIGVQAYSCAVLPQIAEQSVFRPCQAYESGQNDAFSLKLERQIGIGSGKLRRVLGIQPRRAQTAGAQGGAVAFLNAAETAEQGHGVGRHHVVHMEQILGFHHVARTFIEQVGKAGAPGIEAGHAVVFLEAFRQLDQGRFGLFLPADVEQDSLEHGHLIQRSGHARHGARPAFQTGLHELPGIDDVRQQKRSVRLSAVDVEQVTPRSVEGKDDDGLSGTMIRHVAGKVVNAHHEIVVPRHDAEWTHGAGGTVTHDRLREGSGKFRGGRDTPARRAPFCLPLPAEGGDSGKAAPCDSDRAARPSYRFCILRQ